MSISRYLILAVCVSIAIATAPLATNVGRNLEYEYATILSWLTLIIWPTVSIWIQPRTAESHRNALNGRTHSLKLWLGSSTAIMSGLLLPGMLLYNTGACQCSQPDYWMWMGIQVLPAAVLTTAIAALLQRFPSPLNQQNTWNIKLRITFVWLISLLIGACQLAALLWFFPQKRAVHMLTGFIHGPLYDRKIWLHEDLLFLRFGHLIFAICLGLLACKWSPKWAKTRQKILITLFLLWGILTIKSYDSPVSGHGFDLLQSQFPAKITTSDFNLFHTMTDQDALNLKNQIDFHIRDLKETIGPIDYPVVDVYAYPDPKTKKLWFGGGATDITDVRAAGIHITVTKSQTLKPHATLRHELVHALMSKVAFHGLGFHPNMALTEGLAVALAPDGASFKTMSLDEAALKLIESGRIRNPVDLFKPWSFWAESGMRAYTVAGSFIKWFKSEFGSKALTDIYRGASWIATTGKTNQTLTNDWIAFLRRSNTSKKPQKLLEIHTNTTFRSQGVIGDQCPHSLANHWSRKLSTEALQRMYDISGDPRYFVRAMRISAAEIVRRVLANETSREDAHQFAIKIMQPSLRQTSWPPMSEEDLELRILAIDLLDFAQQYKLRSKVTNQAKKNRAKKRLTKRKHPSLSPIETNLVMVQGPTSIAELAQYHSSNPVPDDLARQIVARLAFNNEPDRLERNNWRNYLAGWAGIPQTPVVSESRWIKTYLRLRNLISTSPGARPFTSAEALQLLALQPDAAITKKASSFAQEWYRDLAIWFEGSSDILPAYQATKLAGIAWQRAANEAISSTSKEQLELNAKRINQINMP